MSRSARMPCATEHQECVAFMDWCERVRYKGRPLYDRVAHIPNERDLHGKGGAARAITGRLAAEGVKAGFFDYVILAPFPTVGGLYLEAKRIRGSKTSDAQKSWLPDYIEFGYQAHICKGADEMIRRTQEYFEQHAAPGDWVCRVRFT